MQETFGQRLYHGLSFNSGKVLVAKKTIYILEKHEMLFIEQSLAPIHFASLFELKVKSKAAP